MTKRPVSVANMTGEERKSSVGKMFDSIAKNYDFLNHLLSAGFDILWRKKATALFNLTESAQHLDIACGTGDFAFEIEKLYNCSVTGIDISQEMLKIAAEKKRKRNVTNLQFLFGDAENLKYTENTFNSVTIGFGIRNFGDKKRAIDEIHRVLTPKGKLVILEFSRIKNSVVRYIFNIYFRYILPLIGRFFSKDKDAYSYLPDSVNSFYTKEEFISILQSKFSVASYKNLTFGICTMFVAIK